MHKALDPEPVTEPQAEAYAEPAKGALSRVHTE